MSKPYGGGASNAMERHCYRVLTGIVSAVFLLNQTYSARSDEVPVLDINPVCHGIAQQASGPGERGGPDLSFARCIRSEQAVRKRLIKNWSTYAPADRQNCVAETTMGGLASYTNFLGCLQSATQARRMFNTPSRNYQIER